MRACGRGLFGACVLWAAFGACVFGWLLVLVRLGRLFYPSRHRLLPRIVLWARLSDAITPQQPS